MPPANWVVRMKVSVTTSVRWLSPRIMPKPVNTGEAWMVKGRPDLAKEQLKVIAGICGQSCEEYRDLQAAINGHPES